MINGNSYDALTHNGISQLFAETFQQQEFILQVIQVFPMKDDELNVFMSDGFTWIKGQLINEAKADAIKCNLSINSVIKFRTQSIEVIVSSQHTFKLKSYSIVNSSLQNVIGQPVALKDLKKKQSFINFESGNMISAKKYLTISEVKVMNPGQLSLSILGKVVKKPEKIKAVMNIMIEDQEREQIQCCFFGGIVQKYKDLIQNGGWYYFEDPVLQVNNKFGYVELKISNLSKVVKEAKNSEVKPGIIDHNNNNTTPKYKKEEYKMKVLAQFVMKDHNGNEEYDKYIIARPLDLFVMKNNIGRIFTCVDRFGTQIEVLLWNDCNVQVKLNETYRFNYLKTKIYNQKISLQSQKGQTQIISSSLKILSRAELNKGKGTDNNSKKYRNLGLNDIVYSISQMMEKSQNSKERSIIIICCGYLIVKFDFMVGNGSDSYNELRKRLFYVHCEKCENNEYLKSKIEPESMNGKMVCNGCKSETIRVLWNIKAVLMDSQAEIACKINSQIAEKLIDMTPSEGMLLYLGDQDALKALIQKKLNFKRGVFKFSSKYNDRRNGERFYNICQCYEEGSKIFTKKISQLAKENPEFIPQIWTKEWKQL